MKKILLIIAAMLLLVGCPQNGSVSDSEGTISDSSSSDTNPTSSSDNSSSIDNSSLFDDTSSNSEPSIVSYKVCFNNNGGKGSMTSKSLTTGESWTLTANKFTRVGYSFSEWNTAADGSGDRYGNEQQVSNLSDVNNETVTLYAQWTPISYTIKFNSNGGSGSMDDLTIAYDESLTLSNQFTPPVGKVISYWSTDEEGKLSPFMNNDEIINLTTTANAEITLYAQWCNEGEYLIVYTDEKNANNNNPTSYTTTDNVELSDLTSDNYSFLGWFSSSGEIDINNKVTSWSAGEKESTVLLWAKWCPKPSLSVKKNKIEKLEYVQAEENLNLSGLTGTLTTYNEVGTKTQRDVKYNEESEYFICPDITTMDIGTHTIECTYNPPELEDQSITSLPFSITITIVKARNPRNTWETTTLDSLSPQINHNFWDNANIYFVLIDRFYNGDTNNDTSYNRPKGSYNTSADATKYYGGDIKGLTEKLNYLESTGINAIWITAPYEQIHGETGGSYPYHGYWTLDWTQMDANVGTAEEFRTFVDTAHAKGIRVIMDIVMNHPGYGTYEDFNNLVTNGGDLLNGTEINHKSCELHNWWGIDWLRAGLCTHYTNGSGDLKGSCGSFLPDFITESAKGVSLSPMFTRKLADTINYPREGYQVSDLTNDASEAGNYRMRDYIIMWLSSWVREFGIDGFRCDTAKHVEKEAWYQLKVACVQALRDWKSNYPEKVIEGSGDFWMTGEVWDHAVEKDDYFTDGGFDSLINFKFKSMMKNLPTNIINVDNVYSNYANKINTDDDFNMLTYISSHDTTLCYNQYTKTVANQNIAGSLLTFCPGAIQIYYGDECGRKVSKSSDTEQQTRSQMPWDEDGYNDLDYKFDSNIHAHWSKVLNFRKNHVAVGAGTHTKIADTPYTFSRVKGDDKVIVVLGASGSVEVDVSSVFENGTTLHNGEETATVANGKVTFTADSNGVILIEAAE